MDSLYKFFAVIGAFALFLILVIIITTFMFRYSKTAVPSKAVIEIKFGPGISETEPEGIINRFLSGKVLKISDIVSAVDIAATDRRIRGIVAHIGRGPVAYADVQEIRDALLRYRKSGKPAIAFTETFGESGSGNSMYYLATAFDSIYLQPSGEVNITGFLAMTPFVKGLLDTLSIRPEITAREEYKTAKNLFTETSYTDAQREMNTDIINSIRSQFVTDISSSRKIDRDSLERIIAGGPYGAAAALQVRLVDGLAYRDQVYEKVKKRTGTSKSFISFAKYINSLKKTGSRKGKTIALIYGDGTIVIGRSSFNPLTGSKVMGAQTISDAFRAAIKDPTIGVIIFRVNSPGGSYVASDMIWREVVHARDAGIPVVVSMGAVAGSGGYFVAVDAAKIVAHPATLTGSIGVFGGKMVTRGFYNKLGVTFDHVATDSNALLYSSLQGYSPEQWNYIQSRMDIVYADFMCKVAEGRNLSYDKVKELAKGRVYTGAEAVKAGLIDTLGGFFEAFSIAKELLGIPEERRVGVKVFPPKKTFWQQVSRQGERDEMITDLLLMDNVEIR